MLHQQDPFVNSAKNYRLHEYLDRDRSIPLLQDRLTYATAGHLLETYVDALHVALLLDEPTFLARLKSSPETIRNPTFLRASHRLPPHYVIETLGNYLESPSFFVKHIIGEPNEPTRQDLKQPAATQFAQESHAQLRLLGIRFTEKITVEYFPPKGMGVGLTAQHWRRLKEHDPAGAVREFKAAISEYKQLFQRFSKEYRLKHPAPGGEINANSSQLGAAEKKVIFDAFQSSPELAAYNAKLEPILDRIRESLRPPALPIIFARIDGDTVRIDNAVLNSKFPDSTPALLLTALSFVGRHQIDRTFFPQIGFNFLLKVIGVESSVSDNTERLNQRIAQARNSSDRETASDILFSAEARKEFVEMIKSHHRGIQFLYRFHKTAGALEAIYPPQNQNAAYQDMEQLLALAGAEPAMERLESPKEAATLIYAIERRMRAQCSLNRGLYNSIGELLNKAGHLARRSAFSAVSTKLRSDIGSHLAVIENRDDVFETDRRALFPAISLIRQALE